MSDFATQILNMVVVSYKSISLSKNTWVFTQARIDFHIYDYRTKEPNIWYNGEQKLSIGNKSGITSYDIFVS